MKKNGNKEYPSAAVRIRVMKRDKFKCTYCGVPGTDAELEIDHIHPISKGGSNHMSNLTTSCRSCNQRKSDGNPIMNNENLSNMESYKSSTSGLIGLYVLLMKDGEIHNQGTIIGVDGDMAIVQRFSWLTGGITDIIGIPKSQIYDVEQCKLYASPEAADSFIRKQMKILDRELDSGIRPRV